MKRIAALTMAVCSIALIAACGGSGDDGGDQPTAVTATALQAPDQPTGAPLDRAALIDAADNNCDYLDKTLARFGPSGKTVPGIAEQWTGVVPSLQEVAAFGGIVVVKPW